MLDKEFNQNEKDIMKTKTKNNNATKLYLKQYLNVKKNVFSLAFLFFLLTFAPDINN